MKTWVGEPLPGSRPRHWDLYLPWPRGGGKRGEREPPRGFIVNTWGKRARASARTRTKIESESDLPGRGSGTARKRGRDGRQRRRRWSLQHTAAAADVTTRRISIFAHVTRRSFYLYGFIIFSRRVRARRWVFWKDLAWESSNWRS